MAYERDKDRYTRGVGAIAALDHGNAARLRHRALVRRRTNKLDSAKAEYTYQPGGGIGAVEALGRVNLSGTKPVPTRLAGRDNIANNPTNHPGNVGNNGAGGGQTPRRPPLPSRLYGGAGTMLQNPAVFSSGPFKNPSGGTMRPPIGPVLPLPTPPGAIVQTNPSSTTSGGGLSSGGGGGGGTWGAGGGGLPSYPGVEPPALPDIPEDDTSSSSVDLKTVAIVGGAAFAAWWMFFRKKSGTP